MGAPPNKAAAIRGRTREGRAGGGKKGGWGTKNKVAATGGRRNHSGMQGEEKFSTSLAEKGKQHHDLWKMVMMMYGGCPHEARLS